MRAIDNYHAALPGYLELLSKQTAGSEHSEEATQARWNIERLFKEAVGEAMNDALRGAF